jgi:hypothetical protein
LKKLTRILFSIADTLAFLQILVTVVLLVRMLGQMLTATFSTTGAAVSSGLLVTSWAWFFVALVGGSLGVLGCYLHLRRQVLGLLLIAIAILSGLLVSRESIAILAAVALVQITVYALPWTLMYVDLKKHGLVASPDETTPP